MSVCKKGYFDIVKKLIKVGVDVNQKIYYDILLKVVYEMNYFSVVIILIRVGVDINIKLKEKLIIIVCLRGDLKILKEIIKIGVDVNI